MPSPRESREHSGGRRSPGSPGRTGRPDPANPISLVENAHHAVGVEVERRDPVPGDQQVRQQGDQRLPVHLRAVPTVPARPETTRRPTHLGLLLEPEPVSYTHLTLPTK